MAPLSRISPWVVLTWAVAAGAFAAPADMSRDDIIDLAVSGVGYSYWWGNGCWRTDGTQRGSCSGTCPSCTHTGSYGADCSGYVAKVWQVPSPSPVTTCAHPYSTQHFTCDETWWNAISRGDLQRADAASYRSGGCPGTRGHVLIYERGDPWGSMWTYEARGCSYGIVHNNRTLSSEYRAIRRVRLVASCTPATEVCDGADNDCDGEIDEGVVNRCGTCGPEPEETCDGEDNDCDGETDEGCGCTDADGDTYCPPDDCNDADSAVHPGAPPVCIRGRDNDCDNYLDYTERECAGAHYADDDGCACTVAASSDAAALFSAFLGILGALAIRRRVVRSARRDR